MLSRVAYGYFDIKTTIVFQDWTKTKPINTTHSLSYDEGGSIKSQFIEGKVKDF